MKVLIAAFFATGLMLTSASAAPLAPVKGLASSVESVVVDAQYHKKRYHKKRYHKPRYSHQKYRPGYRYKSRPHGWRHRYHSRPYNWASRGCIVVGPLWMCP